jgi:hypothetical protein
VPASSVDSLKYQRREMADGRRDGELMTVALRYQRPEGGRSQRLEAIVRAGAAPLGRTSASHRPSPSSACC